MNKNVQIINFQDLKKFLQKNDGFFKFRASKKNDTSKINDCRIFGSAYHKILEQKPDIISSIVKNNSIFYLDKIIGNFGLQNHEKNLLLKMIKKFYDSKIYRKYISQSDFIHNEQNICHFIMRNSYIFRMEAIIDAIISMNKRIIIVDYKTTNQSSTIDKTINDNFYWFQLLFYKYILENSMQKKEQKECLIFDLYLVFQSKSQKDNFDVTLKKFSDLEKSRRIEMEKELQSGIERYMQFFILSKKSKEEIIMSKELVDKFLLKNKNKFSIIWYIKKFFKILKRSIIISIGFSIVWKFYNSQYFIFSQTFAIFSLGFILLFSFWFVFFKA